MNPVGPVLTALIDGILGMAAFTAGTLGKVKPIRQPYAYTPGMVLADLTLADFATSTALAMGDEPSTYTDPLTGDEIIALAAPVGGFEWLVTAGTNLPQTIYGYALTDAAGTVLIGVTDPLTDPLPLTTVGQGIDAGELTFRVTLAGVS